ncbi:Peptidyl-prolyl cis-trans isomerase FKBP17-2, chloroplastic [Linum perenne]
MKMTSSMITGGTPPPFLSQSFTATSATRRTCSTARTFSIRSSLQTQQLIPESSGLTRRFGLLSWAALLASSSILSNTKYMDKEEQEVILPNGIKYYEMEVGTGACPREGDLVVMNLKGNVAGGEARIIDTFEGKMNKKKPMAMVIGSRPYSKGMCEGIEDVVRSMKAGGIRRVIVPSSSGFGAHGADFGSSSQTVPPSSTLEYIVEILSVSILPPA